MEALDCIEYQGYEIAVYADGDAPDPSKEFDNYSDDEVRAWREGEAFGYVITDPDGIEVESCWGFYGWDAIDAPDGWVREQCQETIDLARNARAQEEDELRELALLELGVPS